jgi:hypothetical protein
MRQITLLGRTFPAIYLVPVGFAVVAETGTWASWMWAPKRDKETGPKEEDVKQV